MSLSCLWGARWSRSPKQSQQSHNRAGNRFTQRVLSPIMNDSNAAQRLVKLVKSLANRLWHASPAKLIHALKYYADRRGQKPGWFTVASGPAKGAQLFLPHAQDGAWQEMVAGTFDAFLYAAVTEHRSLAGAVCWDVGAHIGYHSLGFASQGAQVLAFEPNRENAERLRLHLEKNASLGSRIRVLSVALSDRDGEMSFVQDRSIEMGSSGSHLADGLPPLDRDSYARFERVSVSAVRADTLVARGERAPDLMKIDVEGAELMVLEGARKLLAEKRPILLMEVHHICLMLHIQKLLLEAGYQSRILDAANALPSRCFIIAVPAAAAKITVS
jgi:FkbM family methyltransferase